MTKEKILKMNDSELDYSIATEFLKWYITKGEFSGNEYWNDEDDYSPYSVNNFSPSKNIETAWTTVVDKLSKQGMRIVLEDYMNGEWLCSLKNIYGGYIIGVHKFDSATRAICKIALMTLIDEFS
jgi:hypothetical protein